MDCRTSSPPSAVRMRLSSCCSTSRLGRKFRSKANNVAAGLLYQDLAHAVEGVPLGGEKNGYILFPIGAFSRPTGYAGKENARPEHQISALLVLIAG